MILSQFNLFHKGISSDPDYSKRANDVWDFPSKNIRILNKKGQGFIITNVDGNTDPSTTYGEDHQITTGYRITGACEYNGIVYITSLNPNNLRGEIGCFPSPNTLDYDGTAGTYPALVQFERQYRPLRNYTTANPTYTINTPRYPLNTTLFDWDMEHQIDIFAREDFDNSVNLYICDYKNPNRVFNSGFDQLGGIKNRLYNSTDFYTNINQILTTGNELNLQLDGIIAGGQIQYGNYIFYFRYLNQNFNPSSFIVESGPCQIYEGTMGSMYTVEGGQYAAVSDKKVMFTLSNLDQTYSYIEVAYTKYYGDQSCVQLSETYLIDFKYPIIGQTSISIVIDGTENLIPLDVSEILKNISTENCCKTHTHTDNMYFGANWKGIDINNDALAYFTLKIHSHYDDSKHMNSSQYFENETLAVNILNPGEYKDYERTYENAGYFRTETYPFGAIYELNNGSYTYAYPVTAYDELELGTVSNVYGIHRFPRQYHSHVMNGGNLQIMGIRMDTSQAINMLQAPSNATEQLYADWIKKNVKAMYFVRGDRIKNLMYQGFAMNTCYPFSNSQDNLTLTFAHSVNWNFAHDLDSNCSYYTQNLGQQHNNFYQTDPSYNMSGYSSPCLGQYPAKYAGSTFTWSCFDTFWGVYPTASLYETSVSLGIPGTDVCRMPIWRGYVPMTYTLGDKNSSNYVSRFALEHDNVAIYSPDFLFCLSNDLSNIGYMERQSTVTLHHVFDTDYGVYDIYPHFQLTDVNTISLYKDKNDFYQQAITSNDLDSVGRNSDESVINPHFFNSQYFANAADDYWYDTANTLFWMSKDRFVVSHEQIWSTRSMRTAPYMLMKWKGGFAGGYDYINEGVLNFYKQKPNNIIVPSPTINLASTPYYKISEGIKLFNSTMVPSFNNSYILYRGDCFLQRVYIRQMLWNCTGVELQNQGPIGCNYVDGSGTPAFDLPETPVAGCDIQRQHRYTHGMVLCIVTENALNLAMRYADGSYDYYPHNPSLFANACTPYKMGGQEALLYNAGHHGVLSQRIFMGYDTTLPAAVAKYPTRIRHSNYHVPYSYIDGYRLLDPNSYKDYDLKYGQINSLRYVQTSLVSVQEHCTNQHFNNEKQLKTPTSSGDLILGMGPILDQEVKRLQLHGTQHQWSVGVTDMGMYGVDFMDKVIWQVRLSTSQSGDTSQLNAKDLPLNAEIQKWIYELSDIIDKRTDRVTKYEDHPVLYEGILTGFDRKYYEVMFTFHYRTNIRTQGAISVNQADTWVTGTYYPITKVIWVNNQLYMCVVSHTAGAVMQDDLDQFFQIIDLSSFYTFVPGTHYHDFDVICCCETIGGADECYIYVAYKAPNSPARCAELGHGSPVLNRVVGYCGETELYDDYSKTLVFNELIDAFTCEYSYAPPFYYNSFKDLFSEQPNSHRIFKHNQESLPNTFYGTTYPVVVSYVVNGYDEKQNTVEYVKSYLSMEVEMNRYNLFQIDYATQYQTSTHNWVTDAGKIWIAPQYLEHKWVLPINIQTGPSTDVFNPGTNMRGKWLLTTLTYQGTDRIEIKNVKTNYILSLS